VAKVSHRTSPQGSLNDFFEGCGRKLTTAYTCCQIENVFILFTVDTNKTPLETLHVAIKAVDPFIHGNYISF
jgi:hypothetical protein